MCISRNDMLNKKSCSRQCTTCKLNKLRDLLQTLNELNKSTKSDYPSTKKDIVYQQEDIR